MSTLSLVPEGSVLTSSQMGGRRYQPTQSKATTAGQDYEVGLCCLLLLRGQRLCSQFFLACNHGDAGLFDDVVFVYRRRETHVGWRAMLVQLKHKETKTIRLWARQTRVKPDCSKLPSDLAEYCRSFSEVKERWRRFETDGDVERTTYVFYSNSRVDLQEARREVTPDDATQLILTGGGAAQIDFEKVGQEVWGDQLPNGREFLDNFLLCYDQADRKDVDKHLEEEVNTLLACTSVQTSAIVAAVKKYVKEWWELKYNAPYLRKDSEIWQTVLDKEVARLNTYIGDLSSRFKLSFTEISDESLLHNARQVCVLVTDECQAAMASLRFHQCIQKSLTLDSKVLEQNLGEVLALWGTSSCDVLVLVDPFSELKEEILLQLISTEKRFVVISKDRPRGTGWTECAPPKAWEDLDTVSKDRLLSVSVTLQGQAVALRDLVSGGTSECRIMSDVLIKRLAEDPTAIALGTEIPSVYAEYLPRCIERKTKEDASFLTSLKDAKVIIGLTRIRKEEATTRFGDHFMILDYWDVAQCQSISAATIVTGNISTSRVSELSYKLNCRGYVIDSEVEHLKYQVTDVVPSTWLISQKIVVVSGLPGIGKSSFVSSMCSRVKGRFPGFWVLRVDMGKESEFINDRDFDSVQDVKAFLAKGYLSLEDSSPLEKDLLDHALDVTGNVFIFLDAFDEISPDYTDKCCRLLKGIAQSVKYRQLVVTTRPVTRRDVEETLGSVAFHVPGFDKAEQRSFIKRFCKSRGKEVRTGELESLMQSVGPVLEVPLLCKMAAQLMLGNYAAANRQSKVALYDAFVSQHVALYLTDKFGLKSSVAGASQLLECHKRYVTGQLKELAVATLLSPEEQRSLGFRASGEAPADSKLGLLVCSETRVDFVHRTFAEFFLGCWLAEHRREGCRDILYKDNHELVTDSFNWSLARGCLLHVAVADGDLRAAERLVGSQPAEGPGGRTALHVAALSGAKDAEMWRLLVGAGVPLELPDAVLQWTATEYAEAVSNWEMVDFLVGAGASASKLRAVRDEDAACRLLAESVRKGLVNLTVAILRLNERLIEAGLDNTECRALHLAVSSPPLVSTLLAAGAEVDALNVYEQTALHRASREGRTDSAALLLEHGAGVDRADYGGKTALHVASTSSSAETAALLLRHGADVNRADNSGVTALHAASSADRPDTAALLLRHGAHVDAVDGRGSTALHMAYCAGSSDAMAMLLQSGADFNLEDGSGDSILDRACREGYTETLALLLWHGADVDSADSRGLTILHRATIAGRTEAVAVLLEHGADVNAADKRGRTALHKAYVVGSSEAMGILLQNGADVNQGDNYGVTVLHRACNNGDRETVALLLRHGADVNKVDKIGNTALHRACLEGNAEIVTLLLEHGADVNSADSRGHSALHKAYIAGSSEAMEILLQNGADLHQVDNYGDMVLHMACSRGDKSEIVELLLRHGADVNKVDKIGNTALHRACSAGLTESLDLLLQYGADVSRVSNRGETVIEMASNEAKYDMVELLLRYTTREPK